MTNSIIYNINKKEKKNIGGGGWRGGCSQLGGKEGALVGGGEGAVGVCERWVAVGWKGSREEE